MSTEEVKAKLVLDDAATGALEKIKHGFEHVGEKVNEVQHEMGGLLKQAVATAAGFQLSASIDSLKELGMEAIHAASGTQEQVKALAGLISMTDKTGMSYEETLSRGTELKDQLEGIGVKAGASADSVVDAFSSIAERSGKSTEEVLKLTDQLAMAGRGVGGITALSGAWSQMEAGIVRPKNQLVMLIRQSGLAAGSAREVAKGLTQMMASGESGKAKAFELAEQAVAKMAAKMKDAPLTFKETIEGLKILRENIFEALGGPMLKVITPALEGVKRYIQTHKAEIEHFAEMMGTKVGVWVSEAAKKIEEGFHYLMTHADEIEKAIVQGATALKDVVTFMIAHKEEIALAYGAKAAAPAVGSAISAGKSAWGMAGAVGSAGAPMLGLAGGGAAASAVALGVFAAAILAVGAAVWQANKLMEENPPEKRLNAMARMTAMQKGVDSGMVEWAQHQRDAMVTEAPEMIAQANALVEATRQAAKFNRDFTAAISSANIADDAQTLMNQFGVAASLHKEGQMELAAKTIAGNQNVLDAMHKAGMDFGTGGEELAKTLEKIGQHAASLEVLDILDKQRKKPAAPLPINFTGPITIKQDFRDQDPDRIAVIFRQDLAKNATNAMGAVFGTPRGAL